MPASKRYSPRPQPALEDTPKITAQTKLHNVQDASERIKADKGLSLTPQTIRQYCRTGHWQEGVLWVKVGNRYLINLEAVYWAIARGEL